MRTLLAAALAGCGVLAAPPQAGDPAVERVPLATPAAAAGPAQAAPRDVRVSLEAIMAAAGAYLATYEREMAAIVAEEAYRQDIRFENRTRQMRSDLLVVQNPQLGWIGFRDVFEVDERPVRDRSERLVKLFLKPRHDARDQALRIVREGTRYNLSPRRIGFRRTINMPLTPLYFLRRQNQPRSTFAIDPAAAPAPDGTIAVGFNERGQPRIIETPDGTAARGAFWIEPGTGRVSAALLIINTRNTLATIHVRFAEQPAVAMWLPESMNEEYEIATFGTILGQAEYSNFRRFRVETTTEIEP